MYLAAVAAPLVIGEIIKDPNARWQAIRIASALTSAAFLSKNLWTLKVSREGQQERRR
jgi:hypothetical protein